MAFIAYHFGWSREEIMKMPHGERKSWISQISQINQTINASQKAKQLQKEGGEHVGFYS
nr:DUF6760 family protein [Spirochaeta cellobiosiphila]